MMVSMDKSTGQSMAEEAANIDRKQNKIRERFSRALDIGANEHFGICKHLEIGFLSELNEDKGAPRYAMDLEFAGILVLLVLTGGLVSSVVICYVCVLSRLCRDSRKRRMRYASTTKTILNNTQPEINPAEGESTQNAETLVTLDLDVLLQTFGPKESSH